MERLGAYRARRDFARTPEPDTPGAPAPLAPRYAIQKHAASRLHFDLRLEWEGAALSWAITRGPSLRISEKRLAVRTEDHPLSYLDFEGTIPKGSYGAGTVMLWDLGHWQPDGSVTAGLRKGHLRIALHGRRLTGAWHLIRMAGRRPARSAPSPQSPDTDRPVIAGIAISNADRVIFPEAGLTKRAVAAYYEAIADRMLPSCADRPVSLLRLPEGLAGEAFFQRHAGTGFPKALKTMEITQSDGARAPYMYLNSAEGLIAAAQMGTIEFHIWGVRRDRLDRPERMAFDLDPDTGLGWPDVVAAACDLRDRLGDLGLPSWPLVSGGKGVHVIVDLKRVAGWETVKLYARLVATLMTRDEPLRFTADMSKARRKGRIFIDWLRNERGATAIAPFSIRARDTAPVAVPVGWDELAALGSAQAFGLEAALERAQGGSVARPVALTAPLIARLEASLS